VKPIATLLAAISALSVQGRAGEVAESDQQKWALTASAIIAQRKTETGTICWVDASVPRTTSIMAAGCSLALGEFAIAGN
jgi:hypothetical protein